MTIHLPPSLEKLLQEQLATGRFRDASDVVGTALRLLDEQTHRPGGTGERSHRPAGAPDVAFGLWKGRAPDGLAYERQVRAEWGR